MVWMKYRTPIQKLTAALGTEITERQNVLDNASIQLGDVIEELDQSGLKKSATDRLRSILATVDGLKASLDELKN